ncbi:MAG: SRPBCC family protein, partial [Hyphomonadaceae bacterium]
PREHWRLREVALASYFVFPNAELFYMQNHLSIFTVFPTGIGEMVVSTTLHTSEAPRTDAMAKSNRVNWKLLNDVLHEDFGICETQQAGFARGGLEAMAFGRYEQGSAAFHAAIDQALAGRP